MSNSLPNNNAEPSSPRRRKTTQTYWAQEQDAKRGTSKAAVSPETRQDLIRQYGDFSLAYSTAVQPLLEYYGDQEGYIAYRRRWGITFALGDAVAAEETIPAMIDGFVKRQKRVVFCQTSQTMARHLADRGFYVNQLGVDTSIELADYDFAGKQKEWLRYAANWCERRNFQICEAGFDRIHPDQVESVSEAWRKTRTVKSKEVRFLNRPITMQDERDVRKFFFLSPAGQLLAFIYLDPLYREGQLVGFVTSIKRRHPEAPLYCEHALMKYVVQQLKAEGQQLLKLGLSPLAFIDDDNEFRHSRTTARLFQMGFDAGWVNRYFYHVQGHANYKRRFRADEEPVYFCSNHRFSLYRLCALLGLCGVA